jgi:hypothetical protein
MKALRTASASLATAIAFLALPPIAAAQYVVPPDNSAVNQYTETVPTAGGGQDTDRHGGGKRSPAEVLGARNARRLGAQGPQGRAAAEVAAATAPDVGASSPPATATPGAARHEQGGRGSPRRRGSENAPAGSSSSSSDPSGSSGLDEVIAQATGSSSSGEMGLFLPLVILAALAWSIGYFWRQRKRVG